MITALCNRKCARACWSDIGVDFREQPDCSAPHSSLIRAVFNGANNLLVIKTFAESIDLGPAKPPYLRTSFAIQSLHAPCCICLLLPRRCGRRIFTYGGQTVLGAGETCRVNCFAAAMFFWKRPQIGRAHV